jgi:hypothetical protein
MARPNKYDDDDDDGDLFEIINGVKVLRDKARWRPPLRMTDAATVMNDWVDQNKQLRDATKNLHDGRGGQVGQRPGFVVANAFTDDNADDQQALTDAADEADELYELRDQQLGSEYLKGNRMLSDAGPPGSYPYSASAEGGPCTINGASGTLTEQDGYLVCVPDTQGSDAQSLKDAADKAYRDYEDRLTNAWRG